MSEIESLETPARAGDLYHSRSPDTADFEHRPVFTGDVFSLTRGALVCPVQHPCAMRKGPEQLPKTLVCAVAPLSGRIPTDWASGHFKKMFLPEMTGTSNYAVAFDDMDLVTPEELHAAERVAILSAYGVNLLLQRWTYHNNRVIIPTRTINEQTLGPYDEADLIAEACADLVPAGMDARDVQRHFDDWLSDRDHGLSRREKLNDAQARSTVRRALRAEVRRLLDERS